MIKTIPKKKKCKKAKLLSEDTLQIAEKRRETEESQRRKWKIYPSEWRVSKKQGEIKGFLSDQWRTQWQLTPVLLPGKSHGWRSLVGCSPWVVKSQTRLSDFTFTFHFRALEMDMATHSSVLTWRIPGTGEPDGLPSMGSHRVRHDWSDLAAAAASDQCKEIEGRK